MLKIVLTVAVFCTSLLAAQSTEADIMVSCELGGSPCPQGPASGPNINSWYIPAINENEPSSEPVMAIRFVSSGAQLGAFFREVTIESTSGTRTVVFPSAPD